MGGKRTLAGDRIAIGAAGATGAEFEKFAAARLNGIRHPAGDMPGRLNGTLCHFERGWSVVSLRSFMD
jgi:hypothetical protein